MLRFRFPGADRSLIFDNVDDDDASLSIDGQTISGWSETRSGLSNGAARMYVYGTLDQPVADSQTTRDRTGWVRFGGTGRTVTLRIATSFISLDQAKRNLALEIAPSDSFRDLADRARRAWDRKLGSRQRPGRDRGPADDAVLEPLPAQPVSQLGVREDARGPGRTRCSRRPRPTRSSRRRCGRGSCTSTTASGTRTGPSGPATRSSSPRTPASSSTASSSSTATAAGSRAGRHPATRT